MPLFLHKLINTCILGASLSLFPLLPSSAQQLPALDGQEVDEDSLALLATLEEMTEIATKTRLNADYVPGALSVLHGDDLEGQGVATVWEALGSVPGLHVTRNNIGEPLVVVRGVGNTLHSGNLKILLNSIAMNNDIDGHAFPVLTLPVEQVERIEVFRGPGSALYGEYAYAGVVNVITRKDRQAVYARTARHGSHGTGAMIQNENTETGLRIYGNFSIWRSDGAGTNSGPDGVFDQGLGFSPASVHDTEGNRFALLGADYAGYQLMLQLTQRDMGDYFGQRALSPPDRRDAGYAQSLNFSLDKTWQLSDAAFLSGRVQWQENQFKSPLQMDRAPGAAFPSPPGGPATIATDGVFSQRGSDSQRYDMEAELSYTGWEDHRWLLGLSYAKTEIKEAWLETNYLLTPPPATNLGSMQRFTNPSTGIRQGLDRELYSATLQDQWQLSDDFNLTGGIRMDNYSDVGDSWTPRLAGVWQLTDDHILKAQYAEAFRPPTLGELYQSNAEPRDLRAETLASKELSYIYREPGRRAQVSLFYTKLDDLITFNAPSGPGSLDLYTNADTIHSQGLEVEWEQALAGGWNLSSNLSYSDTKNPASDVPVAGSAEWLGNASLNGPLASNLQLGLRWRYVGSRARLQSQSGKLQAFNTLDLNFTWSIDNSEGLTLGSGISNLFDDDVVALSSASTYSQDLPQPGRAWWVQANYRWQ